MREFEFVLKNEKEILYRRFALLLFILNALAVCIFLQRSPKIKAENIPGLIVLVAGIVLLFAWLFIKKLQKTQSPFFIGAGCFILYWVLNGYWWIGFIIFCLYILYHISRRELVVRIRAEEIVYPAFPKKIIDWSQLNNIIFRDGLLTIDMKNNRIIQQYTDESKTRVNEEEFNEFCRNKLTTAHDRK